MSTQIDKKQLVKLISFMATFDGGLYVRYTNPQFIMNMRKENLDYINWVKSTLETFVGVKLYDRTLQDDGYNRKPQIRLESNAHPWLLPLWERMYTPYGNKVLDLHMLNLLDAEALSIIFMCDGGSKVYKSTRSVNFSSDITLNTKGFSEADNLALSKAIYEKLNIRSTVNRQNQYRYLRIKSADHQLFADTVSPYILPSFKYKLERLAPVIKLDDDIVCSVWKQAE